MNGRIGLDLRGARFTYAAVVEHDDWKSISNQVTLYVECSVEDPEDIDIVV
jgi:hypothetical protein